MSVLYDKVKNMEISTAVVLSLVVAVVFFAAGFVVARRTSPGDPSGNEAVLREQLAKAQTRAELLDRQRTEDRNQIPSQLQMMKMLGPLSQQLVPSGGQVAQLERNRGQQ